MVSKQVIWQRLPIIEPQVPRSEQRKIRGIEGSITNFFSAFHLRARHDHWPIQSASILFSLTSQWNSDMWTIVFWVFNEQLACIENFLKVCFSLSCPCLLGLFVKHPTLSGCCCLIHKPPSLLQELDRFAHLHTCPQVNCPSQLTLAKRIWNFYLGTMKNIHKYSHTHTYTYSGTHSITHLLTLTGD